MTLIKNNHALTIFVISTLMLSGTSLASEIDKVSAQQRNLASPWPGGQWTPAPEHFRARLERDVSVKMSDGTILKVDISYPADFITGEPVTGKFPVILTQSPYVKQDPREGDYFVKRGYIYVTAHVRGTINSGGEFSFMSARDAQDGAELVMWAAKDLKNSNGIIGLHGGSYMGLTQMQTVAKLGPGSPVKAMQASCMGAEFYRETYFSGGIPTQTLNFQKRTGEAMGTRTAGDAGMQNYQDIMAGGDKAYDRAYWQERSVKHLVPAVVATRIPTLLWSSSGDIYAQSSLELYAYLQNAYAGRAVYGPMPADLHPTGRYQVIISQGGHCENQDPRIQLEWFDTWLKGVNTEMDKTAMPVHIHETGSNRWLNTSHYPVVRNYTRYYLDKKGVLSPTKAIASGKEALNWTQPGEGSLIRFESPSFRNGITLAGPVSASIYASSTTRNLELIATLERLDPDGSVRPVSSGTVLGSLSENDQELSWYDNKGTPVRPYGKYDQDRYIPANTVKKYDFALSSRFVHLVPGSKLRVTFTTQAPAGICSPSLGTDPCFPTKTQQDTLKGNVVTLYHGPVTDSSINLPLLEATCWRSGDNPGIPFWKKDAALKSKDTACQL